MPRVGLRPWNLRTQESVRVRVVADSSAGAFVKTG